MSYAASDRLALAPERRPRRAWLTLGGRLALLYVAVTVLFFAVVGAVVAVRADAWMVDEGTASADRMLGAARRALEGSGVDGVRDLATREVRDGARIAVRVSDERDLDLLMIASDDGSREAAGRLREQRTSEWPKREWQLAEARVASGREVTVVVHNDAAERFWRAARGSLGLVGLCALACLVLGSLLITRRALAPVDDLSRTVEAIVRSGDFSERVRERDPRDELGRLGVLFNTMLDRNERLVRAMRESLDNVAHELRTPLTRLRAGAEVALRSGGARETLEEALADVVEETDRVLAMSTMLMDIAEAETGTMRLRRAREDLAAVVREAVELYEDVSKDRGVHVVTSLRSGIDVEIDRRRFVQVIANLLDNAIKYTRPGGRVEVGVAAEGQDAVVTVADNGVGIAAQDRSRVWERLFRGDRSRSERGLGLGLSLVRAIVQAHGGAVELESDVGRGTTFRVRLRRATAP